MGDRIALDAQFTAHKIEQMCRQFPDLLHDAELLASAIEGETDFERVIDRVVEEAIDAEGLEEGVGLVIKNAEARKDRFHRKGVFMRRLALDLMEAAKQSKVTLPIATVSIVQPRQSVAVDDLNELPQGYFKTIRQADKTAIKAAFDKGEPVPGAHIEHGPPSISIRTR